MRRLVPTITVTAMAAAALALTAAPAQAIPCDYMTGMGWFYTTANQTHSLAKAKFAIAGGCKYGYPTWGHLEYEDKGNGLTLQWTSMTAYLFYAQFASDPQTGQPHGVRIICGKATTNKFGDVDFGVVAYDKTEPGTEDVFIIRLRRSGYTVYTTENTTENSQENYTLGGTGSGGGNIQLYKPNPNNPGDFGGSCPAFF